MGKGRGNGRRGGGGKLYVENEEEMAVRDAVMQMSMEERMKRRNETESDDEDDDNGGTKASKLAIKAAKPKSSEEENPSTTKASADEVPTMSRREREALEAAQKKADYERRHAAGETDQAKADLARLAEVRRRREEARIKREAEGRAPGWTGPVSDESSDDSSSEEETESKVAKPVVSAEIAAKKKAAAAAPVAEASSELPKLKTIDIKKMNPDTMKEHLKARSLSTQGQKKDLMQRLIDFEVARGE